MEIPYAKRYILIDSKAKDSTTWILAARANLSNPYIGKGDSAR
jgi:hypothetical protein